jgi:hypothetical protein
VHVYFLFRGAIKDIIKTVKKARKKGWLKTFPTLRKAHHILQVLACRTKLDIDLIREEEEESSSSSSSSESSESNEQKEQSK